MQTNVPFVTTNWFSPFFCAKYGISKHVRVNYRPYVYLTVRYPALFDLDWVKQQFSLRVKLHIALQQFSDYIVFEGKLLYYHTPTLFTNGHKFEIKIPMTLVMVVNSRWNIYWRNAATKQNFMFIYCVFSISWQRIIFKTEIQDWFYGSELRHFKFVLILTSLDIWFPNVLLWSSCHIHCSRETAKHFCAVFDIPCSKCSDISCYGNKKVTRILSH